MVADTSATASLVATLVASTWVEEEAKARPGLGSPLQGPHFGLLGVGLQVARPCLEVVAKLKAMVLIRVRKAL